MMGADFLLAEAEAMRRERGQSQPESEGAGLRIGIVVSRFNREVGEALLASCSAALARCGVRPGDVRVVMVPGALEVPLALQKMAHTGKYDALIALGAVIRGETYHFEIVANESASGIATVALDAGIPIANGILTTENEEQARARAQQKGADCAAAAIEMANLLKKLDED
jgi:6,7-dimethyl-8-ribityllumazine synthase